jgi:hypothetical protein
MLYALFFPLKEHHRENERCEICVFVCYRSATKDQTGVAAVVSFLIKVYTYEKPRVDQSLMLSLFFWKKVSSNAKISSKLNSSANLRPQTLKVHKNENFFGFDFEFFTISLLAMHK